MTHASLGMLTLVLAVISYSIYFRTIFKGSTKPHGITWLIWAMLNTLIFYQQITHDAGPGAWVTGAAAIANTCVFLFSFKYGERNITRFDKVCLLLAVVSIAVWVYNIESEISVVLASATFIIGFTPTFLKSIHKPSEETAVTFALNSVKFLIALFAMTSFTVTTALYPSVLFAINAFFAIFLFVRQSPSYREQLKK